MKKNTDKWSIQISEKTASSLKYYCNSQGLKMNWFVEQAIHLCISSSLIFTGVKSSVFNSGSWNK